MWLRAGMTVSELASQALVGEKMGMWVLFLDGRGGGGCAGHAPVGVALSVLSFVVQIPHSTQLL